MPEQPFPEFSRSSLRTIATLCGSAALLVGVAVVISGANPLPTAQPATGSPVMAAAAAGTAGAFSVGPSSARLAASTWLGSQQGVTSYGGFPRPLECYNYAQSEQMMNYFNLPPCAGQGVAHYPSNPPQYDEWTVMNGNVAVFSVHPAGVADGYTQVFSPNNNYYIMSWGFSSYGIGSAPTVGPGSPVVLEWSCQPHQRVVTTKCGWNCWNTYEQSQIWSFFPEGEPTYGGTVGSATVYPTENATYNLSCSSGGGGQGHAGLSVTASLPVYVNQPTLQLWADSTSLPYNGSTVVRWQTSYASDCHVSGPGTDWSGANGAQWTPQLTQAATYTLACDNVSPQSVTINVAPPPGAPSASISADSTGITVGQSTVIRAWFSAGANDSLAGTAINDANSTLDGTGPAAARTYTFTPNSPGQYAFYAYISTPNYPWASYASVVVNVTEPGHPFLALTANPTSVAYGDSSTLTWQVGNGERVDSCSLSGGKYGSGTPVGLSGSDTTGSLTQDVSYRLNCHDTYYGPLPLASASVSVGANSCQNGLDIGQYPTCTCPAGQHQSGSQCVPNTCSNGLDINQYPTCTCPSGQLQSGSSCVTVTSPTADITTSRSTMVIGQSATINATFAADTGDTLTHTNIDMPEGNGLGNWNTAGNKTYTFTPTSAGTFTFFARAASVYHPSSATYDTVSVQVTTVPSTCSGSACSITPTPTTVLPGTPTSLAWQCNPSLYTSSQGDTHFSTGGALSGSVTVNPDTTTTYTLTCRVGNAQTTANATVTVLQPLLSIGAAPTRVKKGAQSAITWSATNVTANSCAVTSSPAGTTWTGQSGSQTVTLQSATTYTIRCTTPARAISDSVTVGIIPSFEEI